jgi:hypothetical protein
MANDVAAVELSHGEQVERGGKEADPRGAADGMQKQVGCVSVGLKNGGHQFQDKRQPENYTIPVGIKIERGNDARVKHTIG